MAQLKICQWNCRSAIANKENLELLLKENKVDIALLSETWFKPGKYVNFSGFNVLRKDRQDGRGGVAILIKIGIKFSVTNYPDMVNITYVGINIITNDGSKLSLISLYKKPQDSVGVGEWNTFFSAIEKPFLIGGDFNAHHITWGCTDNNTAGRCLLEAIDQSSVVFLNDGSPTYIGRTENIQSALDLTLTSQCFQGAADWSTLDDSFGSDHLPIIINCQISVDIIHSNNFIKWNINKADWGLFYSECTKYFSNTQHNDYSEFSRTLNKALEEAVPKANTDSNKKGKGKQWWNESCDRVVQTRKDMFQIYKNNPNQENLIKYKKSDAMAKKLIKQTKKESWRRFCSSLNKNIPMKEIWKQVNCYKNRKLANTSLIDCKSDWVNKFHCKLSPLYVSLSLEQIEDIPEVTRNANFQFLVRPFSFTELKRALKQNNNTAPGKDRIQYSILAHLPDVAKEHLLNIYNSIFSNASPIPEDWKDYLIIPILKPGKKPEEENSYRPIALASCLLKTYERIIKNRLEYWLEKEKLLPKSQYGFRRGSSTQDAIAHLVTDIQLGYTANESTSSLFLDIQGAYDNVNIFILARKLTKMGFPQQIVKNIYSLYHCRRIYIKGSNGVTDYREELTPHI